MGNNDNKMLPRPKHLWKPGQSGNPTGKRGIPPEVREVFKSASYSAACKLVELLDHEDASIALKAANSILDRAIGTPTQSHRLVGNSEMVVMIRDTRDDEIEIEPEEILIGE